MQQKPTHSCERIEHAGEIYHIVSLFRYYSRSVSMNKRSVPTRSIAMQAIVVWGTPCKVTHHVQKDQKVAHHWHVFRVYGLRHIPFSCTQRGKDTIWEPQWWRCCLFKLQVVSQCWICDNSSQQGLDSLSSRIVRQSIPTKRTASITKKKR